MLTALLITLAAICPAFGVPISGTGYDLPALNEYTLTADGIDALLNLDASHSFWIGYAAEVPAQPRFTVMRG